MTDVHSHGLTDPVRSPNPDEPAGGPRFFTARAVVATGEGVVAAFAAAVSASGLEVADLLRSRLGASDVPMHVEEGYDDADPFALVMVPASISREMLRVRGAPADRAYRGYRLFVERRFAR